MNGMNIIGEGMEAGYGFLPVGKNSKASLVRWATRQFAYGMLTYHMERGGNIGVRMGMTRTGVYVVVVDRDDRKQETWKFIQKHGLMKSNMQVETASGNWHLYFQLVGMTEEMKTKIKLIVDGKKLPIDIKASGYVLFPPSQIDGKSYQFRDGKGLQRPEDLVPLPESVLDVINNTVNMTHNTATVKTNIIMPNSKSTIARPDRYVMKIMSVQGQNGSAGLVRAVCKLRDAGWPGPQIFEFLVNEWNPVCAFPQWSRDEIAYAVNRHAKGGENYEADHDHGLRPVR